MALQQNNTKKRVWHDIQPAPVRPKTAPIPLKKPSRASSFRTEILRSKIYTSLQTRLARVPPKIRILIAIGCVVLVSLSIYFVMNQSQKAANDAASKGAMVEVTENGPNYPTILPEGKTIQDLGGWIRASPLDKNPVFAYADTISTTSIKVNEQPLPVSFKQDTGQKIEELIRGYGAVEKITAGNTDVHIATTEVGSQSVIFYRDDLLVLITAPTRLLDNQWIDYITSLR